MFFITHDVMAVAEVISKWNKVINAKGCTVIFFFLIAFSFLNPIHNLLDSLYRIALHRKASTKTQDNTIRIRAHKRASSDIRTHYPNIRAGEDSSCLIPRGHCDRQMGYSSNIEMRVIRKRAVIVPVKNSAPLCSRVTKMVSQDSTFPDPGFEVGKFQMWIRTFNLTWLVRQTYGVQRNKLGILRN
jgi:hypothetical protein